MRARLEAKKKKVFRNKGPGAAKGGNAADLAAIEAEFLKYKDPQGDDITVDGVCAIFGDGLELDVESDVRVLLVAWKCHCESMGVITKKEFIDGFTAMRCTSVEILKSRLGTLVSEIDCDKEAFKRFFKFVFQYAREGQQRSIAKETAVALLNIVLVDRSAHLSAFCDFLESSDSVKCITADQWAGFLEFSRQIAPDFSNYDEDGAWPSILDDFVESASEKLKESKDVEVLAEDNKRKKEEEAKAREERIKAKAARRAERKKKAAAEAAASSGA